MPNYIDTLKFLQKYMFFQAKLTFLVWRKVYQRLKSQTEVLLLYKYEKENFQKNRVAAFRSSLKNLIGQDV